MPKITLRNGLKFHYIISGEGTPLVMIHGLGGNLAVWHLNIIPRLPHRFRTLTYDLRGHGYSDVPPAGYAADDMCHDLEQLLDALEIQRCVLMGHSYGADIALYFALLHPQRTERVVAIEAAVPALVQLRKREDWEGWQYWANLLEQHGLHVPDDKRSDVGFFLRATANLPKIWGPMKGRPRDGAAILRMLDETTVVSDYEQVGQLTLENIERITTPVLPLYGDGSPYVATHEYLRAHLPNVSSVMLPKTAHGHFGPLEQPDAVVDAFSEWLGFGERAA